MLNIGEAFVLQQDRKITVLVNEISWLQEIIAQRDATITAQQDRAKADACTIAGYRAYVAYIRSVCEVDVLSDASNTYIEAANAKADELQVPHLKVSKARRNAMDD